MKARLALCVGLSLALSACHTTAYPAKDTAHTPPALSFDPTQYQSQTLSINGQTLQVRAYENLPYLPNPTDPTYQSINIYIPESYFTGGSINGYTAETAPIFMPNGVGGYMPAKPMTPTLGRDNKPNSLMVALSRGYVVASAGARGRTLKDSTGRFYGKAPAAIIDLKSAVRYLKANDDKMAGRADRIIVNGTSAGGALSALLGASGDHTDYQDELNKVGALAGSDSVFAVSSYCPITNLDNADMAYEWQFNGINDYQKMSMTMLDYNVKRERVKATLSDEQQAWSDELKGHFPSYVNGLNLKGQNGQPLTLDKDGSGSFKDEVLAYLNQSLNNAHKAGVDLSSLSFVAQSKSASPYYISDYQGYLNYLARGKGVPAFDDVYLTSGENSLFGNESTDNRHFTAFAKHYGQGQMANEMTVKQMNAMNYVATSPTEHWRIRHGAKDSDTSLVVPIILATSLNNHGKSVDFGLPWGVGHSGDYDLQTLFDWADGIIKTNP